MGNFHKIVIITGTVVIFLSFIISFQIRKQSSTPEYLRRFYLYPLLTLLLSLNTLAFDVFETGSKEVQVTIEKVIFTLDFIFFAYFFKLVLTDSPLKKLAHQVFICVMLFTIPIILITIQQTLFHYFFRSFHNIGKFLFCLIYIYSIFRSSPRLILKEDAAFWIVMGLLFYSSITVPIFLGYYYLAINKYVDILSILFPLTNISIIIMHLLFIKGYLCTARLPKI
jgi:hypothetical protein